MAKPNGTRGPTGDGRHEGHLPLEQQLAARLLDASGNPAPIGSHVDTTDDVEAARRAWERGEVFSVQTPARARHSGHRDYEPGTRPDVIARDQASQRRRLREHANHPAAPESARAFARQELARMGAARCARGMRRRTPTARPAARRAAARRRRTASSSSTSGSDPPQPGDEGEPGTPGAPLDFQAFRELTTELDGPERLAFCLALPKLEASLWRDLKRRCAVEIDRELEARR